MGVMCKGQTMFPGGRGTATGSFQGEEFGCLDGLRGHNLQTAKPRSQLRTGMEMLLQPARLPGAKPRPLIFSHMS